MIRRLADAALAGRGGGAGFAALQGCRPDGYRQAMRESGRRTELIECYDCGNAVSFSAAHCPCCGSREPAGPYQPSARERRRHGIEQRNDRNLIIIMASAGAIGAFYGIGNGGLWAALGYAFAGVVVSVPIAFVINATRWLVR
jgi:hypothetical protein